MREAANDPMIRHVGRNQFDSVCLYCGERVAPGQGELCVDERYGKVFSVHTEDCAPRPEIVEWRKSREFKFREKSDKTFNVSVLALMAGILIGVVI